MAQHNELGKKGEEIALQFLRKNEYRILETNWRFGQQEIDIIAEKGEELIIVEVKTRSSNYYQAPWEAISKQKQRFLINAAEAYIQKNDVDLETRFDVISIVIVNGKTELEHIERAFYPTLR
ncbi:endonuclease [Prolixibacteraceae bacterium JC049]|nr:endonuclease [Prolixibacteraceae bacterium JC049]